MPAPPGNQNAVSHGASSESHVRPLARNHRRRVLRQLGTRSADLDPLGRAYLNLYVRLAAKLDLLDQHFAEVGLVDGDGKPHPATRFYVSLANSTRLALARLEEHVRTRESDPVIDLHDYLARKAADAK